MKNLFVKLVLLFVVYYLIQYAYSFFSQGYEKEYLIIKDKEIKINEKYTANKKGEKNNYLIKITIEDANFLLQTYHNFGKKQEVVKNVNYYKDGQYVCIYPEFIGGVQLFDVICKENDYYINYTSISNKSLELKKFVNELKNYTEFIDNTNDYKKYNFSTVYTKNIIKDHYISLSNYTGIDIIKKDNLKSVSLFEEDIYKRPLSQYVGQKYITANYEQNLYFNEFIVMDIINGETKKIVYDKNINFNSYIMGTVNNSLYLIDKTNKIQYEIDPYSKKITIVGDINTGARYYDNGEWKTVDINELIKTERKFNHYLVKNDTKSIKKGNRLSGYNYHFVEKNDNCDVYRSNVQDETKKTYLFTMKSCNANTLYLDDYIYYVDESKLKYYSDKTGVRTLLTNNELLHNETIIVGGYSKSAK